MSTKKLTYDKNTVIELKQILTNILLVYTIFKKLKLKSNFIKISPYITSHNFAVTEKIALEMAIKTITSYYNNAIAEGHIPKIDWFVKNSNY